MANLEGMNRAESRLYRMQEKVAVSEKWAKMLQKVDFGKDLQAYVSVKVKLNARLKAYQAQASNDLIEYSKDYYKRASAKQLMDTMKHEMVHVIMMQNGISDGHSNLYRTCCHVLGLSRPDKKEGHYKYQHICDVCGWWRKSNVRQEKIMCGRCTKLLVTKAEYAKLRRIAKIGSKLCPVSIGMYQTMTVKAKNGDWMKLKEGT